MSRATIADSRIRVQPPKKLLQIIYAHMDEITEIPANIANILKNCGYSLSNKIETLETCFIASKSLIDIKLLSSLRRTNNFDDEDTSKVSKTRPVTKDGKASDEDRELTNGYLYLDDLRWINEFLIRLRNEGNLEEVYLHELIDSTNLVLPENEIIERDPVLEARCEKLRQEQQNREYMKMTKNVDSVLKNYPEDTIAYQMKTLNKQIIAVFQFVVSVVAGFVFGFLGLELIFGGLDFGLRLLMGIMFALIIALAEIYFLAKKLNEYDEVTSTPPHLLSQSPIKTKKAHAD